MRPTFSRQNTHQGVRFSSQVLPHTEVTEPEGESGPVLGFAESDEQQDRPALSRSTSQLRFSSRNPSDTKIYQGEHAGPSVLSAPARETRPWTEPPSPGEAAADVSINIPDLLATYEFQDAPTEEEEAHNDATANVIDEVSPSLPLSFNDLPSRAQYLILNELLRQNSSDSAVLYTTLPIPTEGTCKSEETSVQYLSDIEVLCNDLPPVLLVLSNNMTYV
jgi:potassium/chloride transporter 9